MRIRALNYVVKIADGLMAVNKQDKLKLLHPMTPQRLNQNTATPQKCRNVRRVAQRQSFAARRGWRRSLEADLAFVCVDLVFRGAAPFAFKGAVFDFS